MVSTWAGAAAPQTPAAQFVQQQPDSPLPQHVPPPPPPPPPPRPAPQHSDDPLGQEQYYQEKLKQLDERERFILQYLAQLKMDRAYVMAEGKRHAIARKEIEEQANILRRATQQQQFKEAELEAQQALISGAWKQIERARQALQQAEASFTLKRQNLQKDNEDGITGMHVPETMAQYLKAIAQNDRTSIRRSDGDGAETAPSPKALPAPRVILNSKNGVQDGKNQPQATNNKGTGIFFGSPVNGTIKVLYREKC